MSSELYTDGSSASPSSSSSTSPLAPVVVDPSLWDVVSRLGQRVSFGTRYCAVGPRKLAFPTTLTLGDKLYHKDHFPVDRKASTTQGDEFRAGSQGTVVLYTCVEHDGDTDGDKDGDKDGNGDTGTPTTVPEQVVLKSYHYRHCATQEMRLDQRILALQEAGEWVSSDQTGAAPDASEPFLLPLAWVRRKRKHHHTSTASSRMISLRNAQWFRVAPYMETDLLDLLAQPDTRTRLSRADRVTLVQQLVQAVHAFHKVGLVFGDLKPENVMLSQQRDGSNGAKGMLRYRLCLVDAGFTCLAEEGHLLLPTSVTTETSAVIDDNDNTSAVVDPASHTQLLVHTYCGHSPNYVSPQRAAVCPYTGTFRMRKEDDVWTLGLLTGMILSGVPAYYVDSSDPVQTLFNLTQFDASHYLLLLHHHMRYLFGKDYVDHAFWTDARSLMSDCLQVQEVRRTTTDALMNHPLWKHGYKDTSSGTTAISCTTARCAASP